VTDSGRRFCAAAKWVEGRAQAIWGPRSSAMPAATRFGTLASNGLNSSIMSWQSFPPAGPGSRRGPCRAPRREAGTGGDRFRLGPLSARRSGAAQSTAKIVDLLSIHPGTPLVVLPPFARLKKRGIRHDVLQVRRHYLSLLVLSPCFSSNSRADVLPALSGRPCESEQQAIVMGANAQLFSYVHCPVHGEDPPHDRPGI
jgi:hypothetical protein